MPVPTPPSAAQAQAGNAHACDFACAYACAGGTGTDTECPYLCLRLGHRNGHRRWAEIHVGEGAEALEQIAANASEEHQQQDNDDRVGFQFNT